MRERRLLRLGESTFGAWVGVWVSLMGGGGEGGGTGAETPLARIDHRYDGEDAERDHQHVLDDGGAALRNERPVQAAKCVHRSVTPHTWRLIPPRRLPLRRRRAVRRRALPGTTARPKAGTAAGSPACGSAAA